MGLKDMFAGLFTGRVVEAYGKTVDTEMEGWRPLTGDAGRDLNPLTHKRMQDLAVHLWKTNPLANRLIELPIAYLLAEGVRLSVTDEEAQGWLDAFWHDPINRMEMKLPKKVRELAIYGEQCWPAFTNAISGAVRLGYLDPALIETVVMDPDNVEQPVGIVVMRDRKGIQRRYRVIVNGPEDVFTKRTQAVRETFTDGECFYFRANDLSNSARGHSDLFAQMDWLDAYDHALFGEIERWDLLRAFIYDVSLKGATPEEVERRTREITAPRPGTVRVHNDSEEWKALAPQLGSYESANNARLFRNHIMGGGTIPEHWFGGGGDVNRATAGEMGEPTFKIFSMRQRQVGHILSEVGTYVIRQRLRTLYGAEPSGAQNPADYVVKAAFPELTARDTSKYAAAIQQLVVAAATGVDRGLISAESAVGMIAVLAGQIGKEIDPAEELERLRADRAQRQEGDMFPLPDAG